MYKEKDLMGPSKLPVVYSCSGCSSAAQMANHIAVNLDRLGISEMSCIAGVGGDVPSLVRTAKLAQEIIAIDGCSLKCVQNILTRHGIKPDQNFVLSELGVPKLIHQDFNREQADAVLKKIINSLETAALSEKDLQQNTIQVREPFAQFLQATKTEFDFELSLLDVVRFAGHACPSMIGAFIISKKAAQELFTDHVVVRGDVEISTAQSAGSGATGPMCNVLSMIFGAWEKSGFGGLSGQFRRRDLLKFSDPQVPEGAFRFKNIQTNQQIDIFYSPAQGLKDIPAATEPVEVPFPLDWRIKIKKILKNADRCLKVIRIN